MDREAVTTTDITIFLSCYFFITIILCFLKLTRFCAQRRKFSITMEELYLFSNAAARHDLIASAPPADPISFPQPFIPAAIRVCGMVYDPAAQTERVQHLIYREIMHYRLPFRAYQLRKTMRTTFFGEIVLASVLTLRHRDPLVWELTNEYAAVKLIDRDKLRRTQIRTMEDPMKEIACVQFISDHGREQHPNVLGVLEVLLDEQFIYQFMPFCSGGDLYTSLTFASETRLEEPVARIWFRQILQVSGEKKEKMLSFLHVFFFNVRLINPFFFGGRDY